LILVLQAANNKQSSLTKQETCQIAETILSCDGVIGQLFELYEDKDTESKLKSIVSFVLEQVHDLSPPHFRMITDRLGVNSSSKQAEKDSDEEDEIADGKETK